MACGTVRAQGNGSRSWIKNHADRVKPGGQSRRNTVVVQPPPLTCFRMVETIRYHVTQTMKKCIQIHLDAYCACTPLPPTSRKRGLEFQSMDIGCLFVLPSNSGMLRLCYLVHKCHHFNGPDMSCGWSSRARQNLFFKV